VAGLLIGVAGPAVCFGFLALAYLAPIVVLLTVIPNVPPMPREGGHSAVQDLKAGIREAARDPLLRGILIVCGVLAFLGVSYMPFLPVLAKTQLHAGAQVLGLMYSVGGIGGLVAGLALASMGRSARRRVLLLIGGPVYAVSLFLVAHSSLLAVTLPALVGISFAFLAINTSLTTLLQTEAHPQLRGRLLGMYATLFAGLQPMGTVAYGLFPASLLFTAIGGGAIVVGATTLLVATRPTFRMRVQ
jgi:predicted MFS family arabinose efflux permease